jgi:hypothetical protein
VDAIQVGPIRLSLRRIGCVIAWELSGCPKWLNPVQRVDLAFVFWRRVRLNAGSVWDVYDELFPPLNGGLSHLTCGVAYVHREQ